MLKHVEQSVAVAAWRWFGDNRDGLAATYEPHMELDPKFRARFRAAYDNHFSMRTACDGSPDPESWSDDVYLATFQVVTLFKQALDAVGPRMLKQAHVRLKHDPFAKPAAPPAKKKRPAHHRDFSPSRSEAHRRFRAAKKRADKRKKKKVTRG